IATDDAVRVVVVRGAGPVFCAGGDLKWMQESVNLSGPKNLEDTRQLAKMFATLNDCPKPVVGLVHGAVIGGGVGLTSICDYVIASKETMFSLAEVRLGIIPACIGPFVLAKIGESHARAYFMSAERFSDERALQIGLVHEVVETPEALNGACERIAKNLLQCGPNAMTAAKRLVRDIKARTFEESLEHVAKVLADLRVTPEGQEGLKAFLEKRKPNWIK
ncbi:MAG: enoyl-CoA hydratase/isomerase family protein, partial [Deltaproteobacteria bacterium]|nr:enoyl-CoA hydratase/isomerase family protein [Deltaproteobacteria bacterium]